MSSFLKLLHFQIVNMDEKYYDDQSKSMWNQYKINSPLVQVNETKNEVIGSRIELDSIIELIKDRISHN